MMLQNAEHFMKDSTDCRSRDNILTIDTSIVRDCGSSRCGSSLIITPKINNDANIFLSPDLHKPSELIGNEEPQNMNVNFNSLYNLIIQASTQTTIEGEDKEDIHITGNLNNIEYYSNIVFGDDEDQKLAFKLIVSAFMVELLKKPEKLGKRKRYMRQYKKYLNVNHKGQFVCFLSGPGGSGEMTQNMEYYCLYLCYYHCILFYF